MNKVVKNFALAIPFAGALFLSGCGNQPTTEAADGLPTIIVADAITTHHLNLYVAYELGLFEAHGVNVVLETLDTNAGARDLVAAGQADVFFSCPTIAIAAIGNGMPIRTIGQVKDPCTSVLYMAANHGVTNFEDLAGLAIAGIGPACEAVLSLVLAARADGVEIDLQVMGGGPSIVALEAGQIDGALLEEPHASIAELAGFERVFEHLSAGVTCRTINASDSVIAAQPEALLSFLAAIDEANEIIMADPAADNIVDIAVLHTGAPEDAIRHGNYRLIFNSRIEADRLFYLADVLVEMGNMPENPLYDMFADAFYGVTWG